ncbi:MAG: tRNA (N(6)-L-threonylcarbamoyladenosine(37)-C(2))-methylthiotransferase MtaB [Ruminococcaceae bacterium]|nr:tRNA (N(6)-L-threonylcarbamoyladenosine(37)-C(2))-methylthiotransferase MtaB [Oscillospiraceae bacterium]
MAKTVAFCTLGCKVNQYESEAVLEQFLKKGYHAVDFSETADVYIINTCTVTHLSDRKSRQMIRRAKQHNPHSVLVVMGCYVQTNPDAVLKIPDVDVLIGTANRGKVPEAVEQFLAEQKRIDLVEEKVDACFEALSIDGTGQEHTRAYIKVQEGCNQFCSYCIIPYARGRIRSRSIDSTVEEAKRLVASGFCELVVTGIHLASWGKDSGEGTLVDLLEALQKTEGLKRIRLGSLEPTLCTKDFAKKIAALDKVCHHFHLSLQSGCDATLQRMNRKYLTAGYMQAVQDLREAMDDAAITTDIMVGFPGETEEEFAASFAFMKALHLADAHVFKYSPRNGTVAAKMEGQIEPQVKEARSRKMIALTKAYQAEFAEKFVSAQMPVLIEQEVRPGVYEGKTGNYITVLVESKENICGHLVQVTMCSAEGALLHGVICRS